MLCPRCKTAFSDKEEEDGALFCGYCGKGLITRKKRVKRAALLGLAAVFTVGLCGVYIYAREYGIDIGYDLNGAVHPTNAPDAAPVNSYEDLENVGVDANTSTDDYIAPETILAKNADALDEYIYQNYVTKTIVTRNGYAYDYTEKKFITCGDLVKAGFLESKYALNNVLLLYLRPADFKGFDEADFGISSELTAFAGCETEDGISLSTKNAFRVAYREHFNEVLSHYVVNNAAGVYPTYADKEFEAAKSVVVAYEEVKFGNSNQMDVKYIVKDAKNVVFVFSYRNAPENLYAYFLSCEEEEYIVELPRYNESVYPTNKINAIAPSFNSDLLPQMPNLEIFGQNKFGFVSNRLIALDKIGVEDKMIYACGTEKYVYIEYESGKKFIGQKLEDGQWGMQNCTSRNEAGSALDLIGCPAPWALVPLEQ